MSHSNTAWVATNVLVGGKKFKQWTSTAVSTVTGDQAFATRITPPEFNTSKEALFVVNSENIATTNNTTTTPIYYAWSRTASLSVSTTAITPTGAAVGVADMGDADQAAVCYKWNPKLTAAHIPVPGLFLGMVESAATGAGRTITFRILQAI